MVGCTKEEDGYVWDNYVLLEASPTSRGYGAHKVLIINVDLAWIS
jgi:hypothetical protein